MHHMHNFVAIDQTVPEMSVFRHFKMAAARHLDLLCACLDHPRRVFCGVYHGAKFGWNYYISCEL